MRRPQTRVGLLPTSSPICQSPDPPGPRPAVHVSPPILPGLCTGEAGTIFSARSTTRASLFSQTRVGLIKGETQPITVQTHPCLHSPETVRCYACVALRQGWVSTGRHTILPTTRPTKPLFFPILFPTFHTHYSVPKFPPKNIPTQADQYQRL